MTSKKQAESSIEEKSSNKKNVEKKIKEIESVNNEENNVVVIKESDEISTALVPNVDTSLITTISNNLKEK